MKASAYNLFFETNGDQYDWVVANTSTGAIVVADEELKQFIEHPHPSGLTRLSNLNSPLLEDLREGAFILDDDIDELGRVCIRFNWARYSERQMHLTIIPATGCNLRCIYCYETHRGRVMSRAVVDKVAEFVRERSRCLDHLSVTWFGGEPLLAKRAIKDLSKQFLDMARASGFTYGASIITNGTLLDAATADMLTESGVKSVQITVDGPPEVHNSRRFYAKGGAPSFDDVVMGIRNCRGKLPVAIRINVDQSNIRRYPELVDRMFSEGLLGSESGNVVSLGLVKKWTDIVETPEDDLITGREFERHLGELHAYVAQRAIADGQSACTLSDRRDDAASKAALRFSPKYPCAAIDRLNYVVMANGDLKKCWIHATVAGTEVGNVSQGIDLDRAVAVDWQAFDPTRDAECAECAYLPVCAGGCPYEMMERPAQKREHCNFIHRYTEHNVRAAVEALPVLSVGE